MMEAELAVLVLARGGTDVATDVDLEGDRDAYGITYIGLDGQVRRFGTYLSKHSSPGKAWGAIGKWMVEKGGGLRPA